MRRVSIMERLHLLNMHGGTVEDAREAFDLIVSGGDKCCANAEWGTSTGAGGTGSEKDDRRRGGQNGNQPRFVNAMTFILTF